MTEHLQTPHLTVRSSDRSAGSRIRSQWVRACVVGELIGFVPPAVTGALLVAFDAAEIVLVIGLVVAGCAEGAVLGAFQARVLHDVFPAVTKWPSTTAIAAGIAWLAGMGGSSVVQAAGPVSLFAVVPAWIVGLLAMGVLQSRRLTAAVADPFAWIPRTTIAWLVGVTIPVVALSVIPNGAHVAIHVLVAIVAAVGMGAIVGVITGTTLVRFAERHPREAFYR